MIEFDVFAESGAESGVYSLLAVSPTGVARGRAQIPPSDPEFEQLLTRVTAKEKGVSIRAKFGKLLFDSVFRGDILSTWAKATADTDGVRLRLVFDPPISNLPWELLHDGLNFLATDTRLAISRYIPVPEPRGRPVTDRLRVLLISASPGPLPTIPPEEINELAEAIEAVAELTELRDCTAPALVDALASADYHVVHYLGHGAPGILLLNGKTNNDIEPLKDSAFAQMLLGRPAIRLVLLSACSSAQTANNAFAGVGPALIRTGVPAVVAMQYQFVQLSTAEIFSRRLYNELSMGVPVDIAVNRSRNEISSTGDLLAQRDWTTPVLYLGTRNGQLITFRKAQATAIEKAAQAVEAAVINNADAAKGWRDLKDTFENLRTSSRTLARLIEIRDLVGQARHQFESIVRAAGESIAGDEFRQIKTNWNAMELGVLAELREAVATTSDAALKSRLQTLFSQTDPVSSAIQRRALGALEKEILKTRQLIVSQDNELAARVDAMVTDLIAISERTLGRIAADE